MFNNISSTKEYIILLIKIILFVICITIFIYLYGIAIIIYCRDFSKAHKVIFLIKSYLYFYIFILSCFFYSLLPKDSNTRGFVNYITKTYDVFFIVSFTTVVFCFYRLQIGCYLYRLLPYNVNRSYVFIGSLGDYKEYLILFSVLYTISLLVASIFTPILIDLSGRFYLPARIATFFMFTMFVIYIVKDISVLYMLCINIINGFFCKYYMVPDYINMHELVSELCTNHSDITEVNCTAVYKVDILGELISLFAFIKLTQCVLIFYLVLINIYLFINYVITSKEVFFFFIKISLVNYSVVILCYSLFCFTGIYII